MQKLVCHPNTPSKYATEIDAHVELKPDGRLWIRYHVECEQPAIIFEGPEEPNRTDFLWKHTCFETFITREGQSNYIEFNFCPSSRWAAYQFTDYRAKAADFPVETAPEIYLEASETHIALEVDLLLPKAWREGEMLMGISAIIEEADETSSYWALKHSGEKPDFHDSSCFIHRLKAAE